MNYSSSLNQTYIYIALTLLISFCVNIFRTESLPLFAVPLKKIEDIEQIEKVQLKFGDQLKHMRIKNGQRNIMIQIQNIKHLALK